MTQISNRLRATFTNILKSLPSVISSDTQGRTFIRLRMKVAASFMISSEICKCGIVGAGLFQIICRIIKQE